MAFCPRCGHSVTAAFCSQCGTPAPPTQADTTVRPAFLSAEPQPTAPRRQGSAVAMTSIIAAAVVLVAVIGGLTIALTGGGDDPAAVAAPAPTSAAATPAAPGPTESSPAPTATATVTATPKPRTAQRASGPGDVRQQPSGLFCRDLEARGFSYSAAVDYYRAQGNPNQMDADRNGIPCETVYSPTDVSAYWGRADVELPQTYVQDIGALPGGLFCRDLRSRGLDYDDAAAYYFMWGTPAQMDADGNGIPCETVYPTYEVDTYWYG